MPLVTIAIAIGSDRMWPIKLDPVDTDDRITKVWGNVYLFMPPVRAGHEWRIFHILTNEEIADFADIKFVPKRARSQYFELF